RGLRDGSVTALIRPVKPGPSQDWLTPETLSKVDRFAESIDGWWTMAIGEPRTIVHCGHEMDAGHIGSVRCPFGPPGTRLAVREAFALHAVCDAMSAEVARSADPRGP